MPISKGLTPKQARFVEEYLLDLNATQAAIRAGYSPKTAEGQGSRLLSNAKVADAVTEAKAVRSKRVIVDQDYVLTRLRENVERAMQAEPVMRDGMPTGEYVYQGGVANGALGLLGKHLGMFIEKLEHTGKDGGSIAHEISVRFVQPNAGTATGASTRRLKP